MAKSQAGAAAMPDIDKQPVRVSWGKESAKLKGDVAGMALGQRVCVTIEGTVTGFSMREYGCDIELEGKVVEVEALGGKPSTKMAEQVKGLGKGRGY